MALMISWHMRLRHAMVPTGVWRLSKWQAIKAFRKGVELGKDAFCFFSSSFFT